MAIQSLEKSFCDHDEQYSCDNERESAVLATVTSIGSVARVGTQYDPQTDNHPGMQIQDHEYGPAEAEMRRMMAQGLL